MPPPKPYSANQLPVPYTPAGMLGYLNMTNLQPTTPNTVYAYSNLGFSIMAQILPLFDASLASLSFAEMMSKFVLKPLGMNDTFFFQSVSIDTFPLGYSYSSKKSSFQAVAPGWAFFDAWYGAGGVVSTPEDMMTWLRFNMGLIDDKKDKTLRNILPAAQSPATQVLAYNTYKLGLSWFLSPPSDLPPGVWKDGEITGTNTFIEFLPWVGTGQPSQAGVFVLTNCDNLLLDGNEVVATIATDVLLTMQGITPPADKSNYPRVFGR